MIKSGDDKELIEETYAEIEHELTDKIYGIENQLKANCDRRSEIVKANRAAKTVFEVFDNILNKEKLDKTDIGLIVERISIFNDGIVKIKLKADIENLLKIGELPNEEIENFNFDSIGSSFDARYACKTRNRQAKAYTVSVISEGDPLEIFTDRDGEVIFKKYSPIGELGEFASQYAETLYKTSGFPVCITDKDSIIAIAGAPRKELYEKPVSSAVEKVMEEKRYYMSDNGAKLSVTDSNDRYSAGIISPIMSEGDIIGNVIVMKESDSDTVTETELKLANAASMFLGKQMEI